MRHYYWDSGIFIAYLNNEREERGDLIDHISQFLDEAGGGHCRIYTSTITIAEILPQTLKNRELSSFQEFVRDFEGAIFTVQPDPNVMGLAASLRGQRYTAHANAPRPRSMETPDAIHLATAITLENHYGVKLDAFHTFDNGKSKTPEGAKSVPMIDLDRWIHDCSDDRNVQAAVRLKRSAPVHPAPQLKF